MSESVKSPPKFTVQSVAELARELRVSRPTVYAWLELPDSPGRDAEGAFSVPEWAEFAQSIGSKTEVGKTEGKANLEDEELRLKNALLKDRLAKGRGEWTPNAQIAAEVAALVHEAVTLLRAKFERELPALYHGGGDERDRALNRAAIDEVCQRLSQPLPCAAVVPAGNGEEEEAEGDQ